MYSKQLWLSAALLACSFAVANAAESRRDNNPTRDPDVQRGIDRTTKDIQDRREQERKEQSRDTRTEELFKVRKSGDTTEHQKK